MPAHHTIVIGASAGGVEALIKLVQRLPRDLPASIFVVVHLAPQSPSVLPQILSRSGAIPASRAYDGQEISPGHIYVAPPDHHLLIEDGVIRLSRGPSENGHRPAIDPLFRSAAKWHDGEVIGVVLSGTLDDGTEGLMMIKSEGGLAIVQDPNDAAFPGMPESAIEHVDVDYVLPISRIPEQLTALARTGKVNPGSQGHSERPEPNDIPVSEPTPTGLTCPACGGSLWSLREGTLDRFQCRVGHVYSPESLLSAKSTSVESAMWAALNALEERRELMQRLARGSALTKHELAAARFEAQARELGRHIEAIRNVLEPRERLAQDDRVVPEVAPPVEEEPE